MARGELEGLITALAQPQDTVLATLTLQEILTRVQVRYSNVLTRLFRLATAAMGGIVGRPRP
jgi:hypothetical protein